MHARRERYGETGGESALGCTQVTRGEREIGDTELFQNGCIHASCIFTLANYFWQAEVCYGRRDLRRMYLCKYRCASALHLALFRVIRELISSEREREKRQLSFFLAADNIYKIHKLKYLAVLYNES